MAQDEVGQEQLGLGEFPELLEMEMEEYDPLSDKYTEVTHKMENLLKNLVLMKISNKRNEINILYLFQMMNKKDINTEVFDQIFSDLDNIFDDVSNNTYKFDQLIAKNNDLGKRVNPMIRELLK